MSPASLKRAAWPLVATLVLVAILFLAVFPTRTWLEQRRERSAVAAQLDVLQAQNRRLAERRRVLQSDAEIERLAREQYNLVKPGEEAIAILPPRSRRAADADEVTKRRDRGFWSRTWHRITSLL